MRVQILSDLHLEMHDFSFEDVDADLVVLAGDTHKGIRGIEWAAKSIRQPVLYVLGNHEYYSKAWPRLIEKARAAANGTNVHLLENGAFTFEDVTFLCCTLWTDFAAFGDRPLAKLTASQSMQDYKKIRVSPKYGRLRPSDTERIHLESLSWLKRQFAVVGTRVVVTHHAPSTHSIPKEEMTDITNAAYASNLENVVKESQAAYWIHGHIHRAVRYRVGETVVISNPRGYPSQGDTGFDPRLTLSL